MKNILIAGGTGFIGQLLAKELIRQGHSVQILSRNPKRKNEVQWSSSARTIEADKVFNTQILINLCGEAIDAKRWSKNRKKALENSRIGSTLALFALRGHFPNLEHYITASGISAYGMNDGSIIYREDDDFGANYISQLVEKWENSADLFQSLTSVTKIRIAMVLDENEGAIHRLAKPIKMGVGSPIGSGKQIVNWIHSNDLVRLFAWVVEHKLEGTYNANAKDVTNEMMVKETAQQLKKKLWVPKIPAFLIKILFGELSDILIHGARVSNEKIMDTGFKFNYPTIDKALNDVFNHK